MALYKYFKKTNILPNPEGPLSDRVPSSSIASPNREVGQLLLTGNKAKPPTFGKRGQCLVYTDEEKARIAKQASEMGVTNTLRHTRTQKDVADRPLKESTIRTWVTKYKNELALMRKLKFSGIFLLKIC